jgi:hypothetical protein
MSARPRQVRLHSLKQTDLPKSFKPFVENSNKRLFYWYRPFLDFYFLRRVRIVNKARTKTAALNNKANIGRRKSSSDSRLCSGLGVCIGLGEGGSVVVVKVGNGWLVGGDDST